MRPSRAAAVLGVLLAGTGLPSPALAVGPTTVRASVSGAGAEGEDQSRMPSISADGRFVAFSSYASNLVEGDHYNVPDVFVHDRLLGTTRRVSVGLGGAEANGLSWEPAISADGRWVAFSSRASNLVPGDDNGLFDVFVADLKTGALERVSRDPGQGDPDGDSTQPCISADGMQVAFVSGATNLVAGDVNGALDVFLRDRLRMTTERVSVATGGEGGNAYSNSPAISADGSRVVFTSWASNLVVGDSNALDDVFLRDRVSGVTRRLSVSERAQQGDGPSGYPSISADGTVASFSSAATNLVPGDSNGMRDLFVRDLLTEELLRASLGPAGAQANGPSYDSTLSADGRYVAFLSEASNLVAGDGVAGDEVFLRDWRAGITERLAVSSSGEPGDGSSYRPRLSADGRFVAFESSATNLVAADANGTYDVFVRDRQTGCATRRVSLGAGSAQSTADSTGGVPSADGRFVAFSSVGGLAPGDTNGVSDVYVRDRLRHTTELVSPGLAGPAGGNSYNPSISGDGRLVAFRSFASDLVPGDGNGREDVFVRDRLHGSTRLVSRSTSGEQGDDASSLPAVSSDGRFVAFESSATNLVAGGTHGARNIFVHEPGTGRTTRVTRSRRGGEPDGNSFNAAISAAGRFVAFNSDARNLVEGDTNGQMDVFVHDRETGRTTRVSRSSRGVEADGGSLFPALSADGRFVAFQSYAANLVHGDDNGVGDVFVHDRATGRTARVSVSAAGEEGNGESGNPSVSADGRFVAFWSLATNFAPAGGLPSNVFVHDRLTGDLRLASPVHDGGAPAGDCGEPRLSADGRQVVFSSSSPYLLPEDTNSRLDVFVRGPLRSLRHADDFAQGALRWVLGPGRWTVEGRGRALSSSAARAANVAVHERPAGDAPFSAGAIRARVRMVKPLRGEANAEVLFHVQNSGAFRFVRLTPGWVVLGQVGGFASSEPGIHGRARVPSLTAGRWHDVTVEVGPQAQVHVSVGGAHLRLGQLTQSEGRVGFRVRRAVSQFDDFEIVETASD